MVTAEEVMAWLDAHGSGQSLRIESGEGSKPVSELIVAYSANITVLRAASDLGAMVCARTSCYYAPPVGFDQAIVPGGLGWDDIIADDPVVQAKLAYAKKHDLVIASAPWLWDIGGPTVRASALAAAIGLGDVIEDGPAVMVQASAPMSTTDIARSLSITLGATHCLIIGHTAVAHRIAVVAGMCTPRDVARALEDKQVDVLVTGESVEWEAVPFTQDVIHTGRELSLIAVGNAISENPATVALAKLLNTSNPPVPVTAIPVTPPAWAVGKVVA